MASSITHFATLVAERIPTQLDKSEWHGKVEDRHTRWPLRLRLHQPKFADFDDTRVWPITTQPAASQKARKGLIIALLWKFETVPGSFSIV